jgi:hypothetical protein
VFGWRVQLGRDGFDLAGPAFGCNPTGVGSNPHRNIPIRYGLDWSLQNEGTVLTHLTVLLVWAEVGPRRCARERGGGGGGQAQGP